MEIILRAVKPPDRKAIRPACETDENKEEENLEEESFRFVSPGVIDVDFEEVRSFPTKYTIETYNNRGNIVVLEYSPRSFSIKA